MELEAIRYVLERALTDTAALCASSDITSELRTIQQRIHSDRDEVASFEHGDALRLKETCVEILEGSDNLEKAHFVRCQNRCLN